MGSERRPGAVVEDQSEVVAFLSAESTHGGAPVEVIETHGALVFLAGSRAIKLKRAIWFPYMDFSTLERRRAACRAELRLNRRTAPSIYLDACPVTRAEDGTLALGGDGQAVDWVVVMKRFDQDGLFDRLAISGALSGALMESLADEIARFHALAEPGTDVDFAGTMATVIADDTEELRTWITWRSAESEIAALDLASRQALSACRDLLMRRTADGFVRRCHGDLHLRNICLIDGAPVLFDCIEFSDALATIDVFYDLCFLLMDLEHRGLQVFANLVFNRYLARTGDYGALPALPLFFSARAAIRAHVAAATAAKSGEGGNAAQANQAEAMAYLELARRFLIADQPALLAIGGLSGSGKSTLACELAPGFGAAPGALIIRSDVLRKRLSGADLFDRLPQGAYGADRSRAVYQEMYRLCGECLAAGRHVIADAVFRNATERAEIAAVARRLGVPFLGLWLDVGAETQETRLHRRSSDVSDATVEVGRAQRTGAEPVSDWTTLNADADLPALTTAAAQLLAAQGFPLDRG